MADAVKGVKTLKVKVASPYIIYFDQPAISISGVNKTGPFDVLVGHHNFITLLEPCELLIKTETEEKRIRINGGLLHVKENIANVFLDI